MVARVAIYLVVRIALSSSRLTTAALRHSARLSAALSLPATVERASGRCSRVRGGGVSRVWPVQRRRSLMRAKVVRTERPCERPTVEPRTCRNFRRHSPLARGPLNEQEAMRPETLVRSIHFEDFSGRDFERLCFAYVQCDGAWRTIEWYGQLGGDSGRDI